MSESDHKKSNLPINITLKEERLIRIIRETHFGEVVVFVQDNQPVRIEEVKKSIKL